MFLHFWKPQIYVFCRNINGQYSGDWAVAVHIFNVTCCLRGIASFFEIFYECWTDRFTPSTLVLLVVENGLKWNEDFLIDRASTERKDLYKFSLCCFKLAIWMCWRKLFLEFVLNIHSYIPPLIQTYMQYHQEASWDMKLWSSPLDKETNIHKAKSINKAVYWYFYTRNCMCILDLCSSYCNMQALRNNLPPG